MGISQYAEQVWEHFSVLLLISNIESWVIERILYEQKSMNSNSAVLKRLKYKFYIFSPFFFLKHPIQIHIMYLFLQVFLRCVFCCFIFHSCYVFFMLTSSLSLFIRYAGFCVCAARVLKGRVRSLYLLNVMYVNIVRQCICFLWIPWKQTWHISRESPWIIQIQILCIVSILPWKIPFNSTFKARTFKGTQSVFTFLLILMH